MKKMYYLSTCSTCSRIMKEMPLGGVTLQDIKHESITAQQLDGMARLAGSYEVLFSRRAMKYRALGLHEKSLTENDLRDLILQEYTFLKRPVLVLDDQIFIGSSKKVVSEMKKALS